MAVMSTVELPARSRPLKRADLEVMPEDGRRYELIDGVLIVTPSPRPVHQDVVANLYEAMRAVAPADLVVRFAPLAVGLAEDTELQPDLLVARREAFTTRDVTAVELAVEVLSPSTRQIDLHHKQERLQRAGCPHYWVVDPDEPVVFAWAMVDGEYVEAGRASGEELLRLERPFPVRLIPGALLQR